MPVFVFERRSDKADRYRIADPSQGLQRLAPHLAIAVPEYELG